MAETVLEVEWDDTGKYHAAYFGEEYDFSEYTHDSLPVIMGLFHDQFSNGEPKAWADKDGIVVQHQVKTKIPWSRVAEVALNSPRFD